MGKTAIAMSGGVDSSVVAWLLKEQGEALTGLTMRLFPESIGPDPSVDAAMVARQLGIFHQTVDLSVQFRCEIMDAFAAAYEVGETPNPCVICNRKIKFGALLDHAQSLGCAQVATGHYVKSVYTGGRHLLKKADHAEKDQSYFLCLLTQRQIAAAVFPLGGMTKDEIRAIAQENGIVTAQKKDSQDICFIPDGAYGDFITSHTGQNYPTGAFLDESGRILGTHCGLIHYTVGQRRGLGVSADQRLYVKQVRPADNSVVLCKNEALFSKMLIARGLNLQACDSLETPTRVGARIRSRQREQPATVQQIDEDTLLVTFDEPQRAVTPGQTVALYDGDTVIGGGIIVRGGMSQEELTAQERPGKRE